MKYLLLSLFIFFNIFAMDAPEESLFIGREADFASACFECKEERTSCEKFFKYKVCVHAAVLEDGFCAGCLENYKKRKTAVLDRAQSLIAILPICLGSQIRPDQLFFKIVNPTCHKYLLRHHPASKGFKAEVLYHKDIPADQTIKFDGLDLGPLQSYSFNIKQYNGQTLEVGLNALIIVLSKKHDGFSYIQTKQLPANGITMIENHVPFTFNKKDCYELTLTLNGDAIHGSTLVGKQKE